MAPSEHFHTPEEWEAIRPVFTRLYQEERKKLDEVRKILEHRFNFTTTVKQCKTKIREWNLGKYKKQRELLHAKRLFNEGRRRGKHVEIRLRGDPVTIDDIAKHFKRKATELDDLDSIIPSSPTPQELTWTARSRSNSPEVEEVIRDDAYASPASASGRSTDAHQSASLPFPPPHASSDFPASRALIRHARGRNIDHEPLDGRASTRLHTSDCVPRVIGIDGTERGFFNLRDLVEADFGGIRNSYPDWWTHLDNIVVDFDDAQFHHMAGRQELAVQSYDRVLESVTRYAQLPSMALLQFVSYLLSWAAIPVSGDVVKVLFGFLQGLKDARGTHPTLAAILPCLLSSPEHASCSIALFQECISNYLTQQLGKNSITVLRMNLRLCRHVFTMDDQEPAWRTLRDIAKLRASCRHETSNVIEPELDHELDMTLQLFDESIRDKSIIEAHMTPCADLFSTHTDEKGESQRHSICNFKLGLYAIAHKQAKATLTCFRKIFADADPRVQTARHLLSRIDVIKREIKHAGVVWPTELDVFAPCDSILGDSPTPWSSVASRHHSSDMQVLSPTSFDGSMFDSPHALPMDDTNDFFYPTSTNQSDLASVTSHPMPGRVNSASSAINSIYGYSTMSAYQASSPAQIMYQFVEPESTQFDRGS